MSATKPSAIDAAPINEIGFTVAVDGSLVDPYDIRGLHQLFIADYPVHSRQIPSASLEGAPLLGTGATMNEEDAGFPPRWWFISNDGRELVQAQERMVGWNWRRGVSPIEPANYPGFDHALESAWSAIETTLGWCESQRGSVPAPCACQLMYDNMISLAGPNGEAIRLPTILEFLKTMAVPTPAFGWQLSWNEHFRDSDALPGSLVVPDGQSVLTVHLGMTGVFGTDGRIYPVLRMLFNAASAIQKWEAARPFFLEAHDYIHGVMKRITTDEIRKSWGLK